MARDDDKRTTHTVSLHKHTEKYLAVLARHNGCSIAEILAQLGNFAADGMRRPGAWERGWLAQAFADDWVDSLEQVPGVRYAQLQPIEMPNQSCLEVACRCTTPAIAEKCIALAFTCQSCQRFVPFCASGIAYRAASSEDLCDECFEADEHISDAGDAR